MKASQAPSNTADKPAQKTAGTVTQRVIVRFPLIGRTLPLPIKTIPCAFGDIEILGDNRFVIAEFAQFGGRGYYVPSTDDLETIEAILNRTDWTELEINEAVAALNEQEGE